MDNTVFEEVRSRLPNASDGFLRNLLAAFLFKGDEVFKKVRYLSGGEKARVILAGLLSCPHNLLLLDEPTASLDPETGDYIREFLQNYQK